MGKFFHPYLLILWHSCLAASASQLCFPSRKRKPRCILTEWAAFFYRFGFFCEKQLHLNLLQCCWLPRRMAGSQSSSDGTQGTVLIYIHRGSLLGALLSGISFHFCNGRHFKLPLRNQTKLLKIPLTTSQSPWNHLWTKNAALLPVTSHMCPCHAQCPHPACPRTSCVWPDPLCPR